MTSELWQTGSTRRMGRRHRRPEVRAAGDLRRDQRVRHDVRVHVRGQGIKVIAYQAGATTH